MGFYYVGSRMKATGNFEFYIDIVTNTGWMVFYLWVGPEPFTKQFSIEFGMFSKMFFQWTKEGK